MADARLRELERQPGDVGTRARALVERLRRGELTRDRLELAAYCYDRAAITALGPDGPMVPITFPLWLRGLTRWGSWPAAAEVRAVRACVERFYARETPLRRGCTPEEAEGLVLVDDWLETGTPEPAAKLGSWCAEEPVTGVPVDRAALVPGWLFSLAAGVQRVAGLDRAVLAHHPVGSVVDLWLHWRRDPEVPASVRRELVAWALDLPGLITPREVRHG